VSRRIWLFISLFLLLVIADQTAKWLVIQHIAYRSQEIVIVPGFFSLVHVQNTGAAFGMLQDSVWRYPVFGVFTLLAVGVLTHMCFQLPDNDRFQTVALSMIMAGAVGNAVDRVYNAVVNGEMYVTDYLRVFIDSPKPRAWLINQFHTNEWPSFNVADICIVVGLSLFMIYYLFIQKDEVVAPEPPAEPVNDLPTPR